VDGADHLVVTDPGEIARRDAEVAVPELALDPVQRRPLAGHLNRVGGLSIEPEPRRVELDDAGGSAVKSL
jgi:hypothetical protein